MTRAELILKAVDRIYKDWQGVKDWGVYDTVDIALDVFIRNIDEIVELTEDRGFGCGIELRKDFQ